MSEDALPPLRDVIARHGLRARKSYGQHFLLDLNLTRKIARVVPDLKDSIIYEVGPGPGGLTRALLEEGAHQVISVEKDERCGPALNQISAAFPGRLTTELADALALWEPDILAVGNRPVQVAANLPYNIGTALLVKWLSLETWPPVDGLAAQQLGEPPLSMASRRSAASEPLRSRRGAAAYRPRWASLLEVMRERVSRRPPVCECSSGRHRQSSAKGAR